MQQGKCFTTTSGLLMAGFILSTQPTLAQNAPTAETTLQQITVKERAKTETATGPVTGYIVKRVISGTKTDTPLNETPQSITVITADQITDQGALSLQAALTYAAGVRSDAYGLDSRADGFRVRGSYPDEYLDGLRMVTGYYDDSIRTDPYSLERIEVLRGPSAMLYGQGSTAGIVNMVSKRPLAEEQGEIVVKFGSYSLRQIQADLTGPLTEDRTWLYRIIAVGREAGTQVDHVDDDRKLLAPSLTWQPSEATTLTLLLRWQQDKSGSTSQFLPWSGNLTRNPNGHISTDTFLGEPGFDRYNSERQSVGWSFEHEFNKHWTLRQNFRYAKNDVDYRTLYADSFHAPSAEFDPLSPFPNPATPYLDTDQRIMGRFLGVLKHKVQILTADQHVQGKFETAGIEHTVLLGFDALNSRQTGKEGNDYPTIYGGTVPNIDVYYPVPTGIAIPSMLDIANNGQRAMGFYAQDQIKHDKWIVVTSLRHDRTDNSVEGVDNDSDSSATSKHIALMYAADNGVSPFISYSESFTPIAGLALDGSSYKPLRGEQWEVGLKYQPSGQPISAGIAVYDLREKNQRVPDLLNPLKDTQADETKNTGAELEARAALGNFELIANYNYTHVDDALEGLPENQASVWGKWNFSLANIPGFSAGAGVRYLSSFADGIAPTTPSVTLADALLGWEAPHWRLAVNANNLTDKIYNSTCLSRGDCWIGPRRNVVASAAYRW